MTFHTSDRLDPLLYNNTNFDHLTGVTDGTNPLLPTYPNTYNFNTSPQAGQIGFRFFEV
jgi:hypothetical protein